MSVDYNTVNSFPLDEQGYYLFFDIFHKNGEIVLICPAYTETFTDYDRVKISVGDNYIPLKDSRKKITYEPIVVLIFSCETVQQITSVKVEYKSIIRNYDLVNHKSHITKTLSQTTLFKDDYKLIELFYPYYKNQGVEEFYLYYNGKLTDDIISLHDKEKITLIEWDFRYWNSSGFSHHAQMGQLHHSLYKYGKDNTEFMIFNDYDEYMFVYGRTLLQLVLDNKYDTYGFCNYWVSTLSGDIPESFPSEIRVGKRLGFFDGHSKCIHKTSSVTLLGIHRAYQYEIEKPLKSLSHDMLHFYSWTKPKRSRDTFLNVLTSKDIKKRYNNYMIQKKIEEEKKSSQLSLRDIEIPSQSFTGDLYVYWHICGLSVWKRVVSEQLSVLKISGVYDRCLEIRITYLGDENSFIDRIERENGKIRVVRYSKDVKHYERLCLMGMREDCKVIDDNTAILYIHSKGVTRPQNEYVQNWRRMMEHYLIKNHMTSLSFLEAGYDTVGCNLVNKGNKEHRIAEEDHNWHFSGNFWIASAKYIKRLPPIPSDMSGERFWLCERWILQPLPHAKIVQLYHSGESVLYYRNSNYKETPILPKTLG